MFCDTQDTIEVHGPVGLKKSIDASTTQIEVFEVTLMFGVGACIVKCLL